jgi:hypothetical protein
MESENQLKIRTLKECHRMMINSGIDNICIFAHGIGFEDLNLKEWRVEDQLDEKGRAYKVGYLKGLNEYLESLIIFSD